MISQKTQQKRNKQILICFISLISLFRPDIFSQKRDTIILTNNNILIGKVYKYLPEKYLCIKTINGQFTFEMTDVQKMMIHSIDIYENGIDENIPSLNEIISKVSPVTIKKNRFHDDLPVNMFFVQGGAAIYEIVLPFDPSWQFKVQAIYSRRFWKDNAIGIGLCNRYMDDSRGWTNFFFDYRHFKNRPKHFSSWSIDIGTNQRFETVPRIYLNLAYTKGFRISRNFYYTLGFEFNHESYSRYVYWQEQSGKNTLGLITGILF